MNLRVGLRMLMAFRPLQLRTYLISQLFQSRICWYQISLPKAILPDTSMLQISTFRKKPAKLKKHKRKQKRKKIRRMNKANKERRNY